MYKFTLSVLLIISSLLYTSRVYSQAPVTTSVIGCYTCGGTPVMWEGVDAKNAWLFGASGVAVDNADNVYVSDRSLPKIRKADAATGKIYTIAGTGAVGFAGDGGPALAAEFDQPRAICLDKYNNVYVVDAGNKRIRKINAATGDINTIAGGGTSTADGVPAVSADIGTAKCVAVDSSGTIYIADGSGNVRVVDPATGLITTLTGVFASWLVIDPSQNLYFSLSGLIQKRDVTGTITPIAGGGTSTMDNIPAITADLGGDYFNVDAAGNVFCGNGTKIRKVDVTTGLINILGGCGGSFDDEVPAMAAYSRNYLFCTDSHGNLFYSDSISTVRKIYLSYDPAHFNSYFSDSFNVLINKYCAGPTITINAVSYYPGLNCKVYFGDGQKATFPILVNCPGSGGYVTFSHNYAYSGTYTIKFVLCNGSTPLDSLQATYNYALCNSILVNNYHDLDGNCVNDPNDINLVRPALTQIDSNGVTIDSISSLSGFYYSAYGGPGDFYKYRIRSLPTVYSLLCPLSGVLYDTLDTGSVYNNKKMDFGLDCSTGNFDLSVNAVTGRTGKHEQEVHTYIGIVSCALFPATVTVTASPKYGGDQQTWFVSPLTSSLLFDRIIIFSTTIDIPIGDTVHTHVSITPISGDINPVDNNYLSIDTVRASYDPNIITVNPAGYIPAGTLLEYTIEFENTGNDTAFNIFVLDTLSEHVAFESFKVLSASAKMITTKAKMGAYNVLKFDFPGINLPDSSHHDLCHGMLKYTIRAKTDLPFGTLIHNSASIYFDYNEPVKTNTVTNIIGTPTAVAEVANEPVVVIYPNPANNELTITADKQYTSYTVTNTMGQQMMQQPISASQTKVNIKALPAGLYYINLKGEQGGTVRKFVKL